MGQFPMNSLAQARGTGSRNPGPSVATGHSLSIVHRAREPDDSDETYRSEQ